MRVLTFSRTFPKGHPKATIPTYFVEQILNSILPRSENGIVNRNDIKPEILPFINDFILLDGRLQKHTTICAGHRFKPGDMVSLRVWLDKPYRSKQIEFAQVEVKKTWDIKIAIGHTWWSFHIDNKLINDVEPIAINDGLTLDDFIEWFTIHPKSIGKEFNGQIICWNENIEY